MNRYAVRMQIVRGNTLVAEAIFESAFAGGGTWDTPAGSVFADYAMACYRKGLPFGGAVIQRADLPRTWDVPVGAPVDPAYAFANDDTERKR